MLLLSHELWQQNEINLQAHSSPLTRCDAWWDIVGTKEFHHQLLICHWSIGESIKKSMCDNTCSIFKVTVTHNYSFVIYDLVLNKFVSSFSEFLIKSKQYHWHTYLKEVHFYTIANLQQLAANLPILSTAVTESCWWCFALLACAGQLVTTKQVILHSFSWRTNRLGWDILV